MKTGKKKVFAVLIVILLIASWFISFFGIGDKVGNLGKQLKYGLDINGGVYVLLEADTEETGTELTQIMNQTKSVLENRVNAMGISEAQVSIEGNNRIRVEMPGVENAEEAIEQIGRTAQLQFFLADGTLALTGEGISDSQIATDSNNGGYKITIDFTAEGSNLFADATEKAYSGQVESKMTDEEGNPVANTAIVIALDDEVISAPTVNEKINSRSCEITRPGGFSETEASGLSALIRGGALPANLTEINSSVQTATIGANALALSVKAGAIGLALNPKQNWYYQHLAFRLEQHYKTGDPDYEKLTVSETVAKYDLTRREHTILKLLMSGKDNNEICEELVIAPNTLKKHILNIYRKLGINNRVQLFKSVKEFE